MKSFFDPDNNFFCAINTIIDMIILSLIFIISCIPIITIGSACAALYYTVVKVIRKKRSYCVKEYCRAFQVNMKKGILINIILIFLYIMFLMSDIPLIFTFIGTGEIKDKILLCFFSLKIVILVGFNSWIYPLLSRYEEKMLKLSEAALFLLVKYFPVTLWNFLIIILSVFLLIKEPLLVVIVPAISAFLMSLPMELVLQKIYNKEEYKENEDCWFLRS